MLLPGCAPTTELEAAVAPWRRGAVAIITSAELSTSRRISAADGRSVLLLARRHGGENLP